jgi:hypothetical protein
LSGQLSLAFLVLLNAQSDLILPALQLARLFVVFVLRNSLGDFAAWFEAYLGG